MGPLGRRAAAVHRRWTLVSLLLNLLLLLMLSSREDSSGDASGQRPGWDPRLAVESIRTVTGVGDEWYEYALQARLTHVVILLGAHQIPDLQQLFDSWIQHPPLADPHAMDGEVSLLAGPLSRNVSLTLYYVAASPADVEKMETLGTMFRSLPPRVREPFACLQVQPFFMRTRDYAAYHGRRILFDRLVNGYLGLHNVQYVLYLNVNSRPLRSNWLLMLDASVRWPNPFVLIRSSYVQPSSSALHCQFDETGIYHLGSSRLRRMYQEQVWSYPDNSNFTGYFEEKIARYLTDPDMDSHAASLRHLFQPTQLLLTTTDNATNVEALRTLYPWLQLHRIYTH